MRSGLPMLAAGAVALALAGCGGSSSSTTDTTASTTAPTQTAASQQHRARPKAGPGKEDGSPASGSQPAQPTGPAPTAPNPLPNQGTRKAAPGVPLVPASKNGNNSVQTYGLEARSADRVEAARLVKAFLDARAARRWGRACSYLTHQIKLQMQAMAAQSQGGGGSSACVSIMAMLAKGVPEKVLRTLAQIQVLSLRVNGDSAIVIYRDGYGTPSTIPLARGAGVWKVGAAAGSQLFLGP